MKLKDKHGKPTGPYRVFNKYGFEGGLAMSRSIGDKLLTKAGVISTPEFIEYDITQNDQVLIIASDGVWEFLSNEDIIQLTQTVSHKYTLKIKLTKFFKVLLMLQTILDLCLGNKEKLRSFKKQFWKES